MGKNFKKGNLFHAYNILKIDQDQMFVDHLYPMLEGQVALLSSGSLNSQSSIQLLNNLFKSAAGRQWRAEENFHKCRPHKYGP